LRYSALDSAATVPLMPSTAEWVDALRALLGDDPLALALAWARALPLLILVPAFGLGGVAAPIRAALAFGIAGCIAPALHGVSAGDVPFWFALVREAAGGVPLALATASILWAAVMAGGLVDNLRGGRESVDLPVLDEPSTLFGALFGLLVAIGFLETGGAERVASALAAPHLHTTFAVAAERLADSVGIAVAVAAPLVAGSLLLELAGAFIARAASPAYVAPLVAPLRSLGVLLVVWLALDRVVGLLLVLAARA
jgi:type III secretory pathway component EscT